MDKLFQQLIEIQETDGDIYDAACKMAKNIGKSARESPSYSPPLQALP